MGRRSGLLGEGGAAIAGLSGVLLTSTDARHFTLYREADRRGLSGLVRVGAGYVLVGEGGVRTLDLATGPAVP